MSQQGDSATRGSTWEFETGDELAPRLRAWALLGQGRRFETWMAWCLDRWSPVVVKLPRRDSMDEHTLGALQREGALAASLSHPSIQRLLDDRTADPLAHLVYEYVEGPTLSDLLDEEGALAPPDAIRLGMHLAAALHYLHGRGIVHLDLKPENVVVREGRPMLLDFDIALPLGTVRSTTKPRGTHAYMAPEQVRCEPAMPSMDLWALGCVLYEAVSGATAFEVPGTASGEGGGSDPRDAFPQLTCSPVPVSARIPDVPPALDRVIRALLDADPSGRPADAAEVMGFLDGALRPDEEGLWPGWVTGLAVRPGRTAIDPERSLTVA